MLSFGYTLLLNNLIAVCQIAGLDPDLGFFHAVDFGKPAMALDLEEEFRPVLVDSIVLTAVNRGYFKPKDFDVGTARKKADENREETSVRPVNMKDDARARFISLYENRLSEQVIYPATGERTTYRRVMELQAYHIARVILGQEAAYQPFTVR